MATESDEYNSLREEIMQHQARREQILNFALTASVALFGISVQMAKPYLSLLSLLLLYYARLQIAHTDAGIERIASYIRYILEEANPALNWEQTSYEIRRDHPKFSSLFAVNRILLVTSVIAVILSLLLSEPFSMTFFLSVGVSLIWLIAWVWYDSQINKRTTLEESESFWSVHKNNIRNKTLQLAHSSPNHEVGQEANEEAIDL